LRNQLFMLAFTGLLSAILSACEQAESPSHAAQEGLASNEPLKAELTDTKPIAVENRITLPILDATTTRLACSAALEESRSKVEALEKGERKPDDLLAAWDRDGMDAENLLGPVYLLTYTHPSKAMRDAGEACILKMTQFQNELYQNPALYSLIQAVEPADGIAAELQRDLIHSFEDTGVNLPEMSRVRAAEIIQTVQGLSQEFQRNLRENTDKITFTEAEVSGLPDSWKDANRQDDGSYAASYDYPQYFPFMRNATDGQARKRYHIGFSNRGGDRNQEILNEIVGLRKELAALHGLDNFAALITKRRMVKTPETVHDFLNEVSSRVRDIELADLELLKPLKAKETGEELAATQIYRWDLQYYLERLRKQRFDIDQEALREYFPTPETVAWTIDVSERLYGITLQPATVPVWDADVQYFDVLDAESNEYLGGIYLDLYPRDGKYKHAAAFGVRSGSTLLERKPISVLVTNFDRTGLTHSEVETLMHEFGHVLHGVLSKTRYGAQSGTSVMRDFVEAPSQMFEEWARRAASLDLLAEHCRDCPKLSDDLIERLDGARKLGKGIFYSRQHLYASYDMALAGPNPGEAQAVWVEMESATPVGHVENTHFPATFGHIAGGYAAGYYGYMWSEVLALDMLSGFGDDIMNPEIGQAYREKVLSRGGEQPPLELVTEFLGRAPNSDAFFEEISGQR